MSSRLKILPKKSYCPWSEENVQKVLRDEEQHAREVEAANQRKRQDHWEKEDGINTNLASNGHFSLFAKEEKEAHITQEKKLKEKDRRTKQKQRRPAFDPSKSAAMDAAVGLKSREHKHSRMDVVAKNRLDPMSDFCKNNQDEKSDQRVDNAATMDGYEKHSRSRREDRGRSHSIRRQRRRSHSSSSSSSKGSSPSSSSQRRHRKRPRKDSKSRKNRDTTSSSQSSYSDHEEYHRSRLRHHSKSRKKRKDRNKNAKKSTATSKEEKAKQELLLKCAQREEEERLRQGNLRRHR